MQHFLDHQDFFCIFRYKLQKNCQLIFFIWAKIYWDEWWNFIFFIIVYKIRIHWGLVIRTNFLWTDLVKWTACPYNQTPVLEWAKTPSSQGLPIENYSLLLKWAWFQLSKEGTGILLILSFQMLHLFVSKTDLLLPRYSD